MMDTLFMVMALAIVLLTIGLYIAIGSRNYWKTMAHEAINVKEYYRRQSRQPIVNNVFPIDRPNPSVTEMLSPPVPRHDPPTAA